MKGVKCAKFSCVQSFQWGFELHGLNEVELKAQGFKGIISVEYENKWDDNVGDVKENIAFVKAWGEKNK